MPGRNVPKTLDEEVFFLCARIFLANTDDLDFDSENIIENCPLWEPFEYWNYEDIYEQIANAAHITKELITKKLREKEVQLTLDLQPKRGIGSFIVPYNLLSLDVFHKLVVKLDLTNFTFEGRKCTGSSPFFAEIGPLEPVPMYKIMASWDLETITATRET